MVSSHACEYKLDNVCSSHHLCLADIRSTMFRCSLEPEQPVIDGIDTASPEFSTPFALFISP